MSRSRFYWFVFIALLLFFPLFIVRSMGQFDFWWWLSTNILFLSIVSFLLDPDYRRLIRSEIGKKFISRIGRGLVSAIVLYAVFWAGNWLSRQILPFAGSGINHVYDFRQGASSLRIVILMLLIIGPGEELLWRGFIQRNFSRYFSPFGAFIITAVLYTGIHIGSMNVMLILAALVCGVFWGLMFWRFQSVTMNIVSHTVWDLLVFIIFPFVG